MLFDRLLYASAIHLEQLPEQPFLISLHSGKLSQARYRQFLNDLYHVVWHFCPTMAAGASRCNDDYAAVRYALYEHIAEEKGHEAWVLEDCEAVGGADFAQQVRTGLPCADIQAMNAFNYYASERQHPVAVLAMVFTFEIISARLSGGNVDAIASILDLSRGSGIKFLASHGSMDQSHLAAWEKTINTIEEEAVGDVIVNAVNVNFKLFSGIFQ